MTYMLWQGYVAALRTLLKDLDGESDAPSCHAPLQRVGELVKDLVCMLLPISPLHYPVSCTCMQPASCTCMKPFMPGHVHGNLSSAMHEGLVTPGKVMRWVACMRADHLCDQDAGDEHGAAVAAVPQAGVLPEDERLLHCGARGSGAQRCWTPLGC